MPIIDRYLLRQYIKTFLICWFSLTGLYVVVDAFSNLDEFLRFAEKSGRPLFEVLGEFYFYRTISFFDRISAILAMVAGMFTVTWIQRHQELTALMAAGISRIRVARPVFWAAATVTLVGVASRELIIPSIRDNLSRDPKDLVGDAAVMIRPRVDHETSILFGGKFANAAERKIHGPKFVLPIGLDMYGKFLTAVDAFHEPANDKHPAGYRFKGAPTPTNWLTEKSATISDKTILYTPADHGDWLAADELFVASNVDFDLLGSDRKYLQFMSTWELARGLRNPSLDYGADVRTMIHSRVMQPFLDVTLVFLGLPLVLRRETRNVYAAVGMCIGLTVGFMLVTMACHYLGDILYIRPALAGWLPLMIFVPIAAAMYDRIDR
jgi:lipopolysaccharide export system permease protein